MRRNFLRFEIARDLHNSGWSGDTSHVWIEKNNVREVVPIEEAQGLECYPAMIGSQLADELPCYLLFEGRYYKCIIQPTQVSRNERLWCISYLSEVDNWGVQEEHLVDALGKMAIKLLKKGVWRPKE